MIEFSEHFYDDDPMQGHPDVRTRLKGASYFFIGNGLIQAAVQASPEGEGTPIGLLIMNPEQLRKKREALTIDKTSGLEDTMLCLDFNGKESLPSYKNFSAEWDYSLNIPAVIVNWETKNLNVNERFCCPNRESSAVVREVKITNLSEDALDIILKTGVKGRFIDKTISISPGLDQTVIIYYRLNNENNTIDLSFIDESPGLDYADNRNKASKIEFDSEILDRFYKASSSQLNSMVSRSGRIDASIWQYNREWVRDHSMMAVGLIFAGHFETARTVLERLLNEFVTEDGDTIDSSEKRTPDEVELDQNGLLLYALKHYTLWSGDTELVSEYRDKIKITAEYPLKNEFRHERSGMLCNTREFWERHRAHGVEKGLELSYQLFTIIGLKSAACLARITHDDDIAMRWEGSALKLKNSLLNDAEFSMTDERGFIKRRTINGEIQEIINAQSEAELPSEVPLSRDEEHFLNPDSSSVLPVVYGLVKPDSIAAVKTMESIELLWNQDWEDGGYARYHVSSEPDSPGGWSFPSIFIARAYLETGDNDKVRRILDWLNSVPGSVSGSWFENYGNRISPPYPQVGITPWTWAEMIILCINHICGIRPEEDGIHFRPVLLPWLKRIKGNIRLRHNRLIFDIKRDSSASIPCFQSSSSFKKVSENEIVLQYHDNDIIIEALLP
ncbi:hypothetical protein ACFL6G_07565 [candidate division KSB1 bacterium]